MTENLPTVALGQGDENPLESWKEIAAYLKRGVRTVKRWENSEGLPVHRHMHKSRSSVYAYPSELDAWWAKRPPAEEAAPESWFLRPARAMALAAALLLALLTAGDGRLFGPPNIAAQTQGITTRQVWAGADADPLGAPSPDGRHLSFVDWETGDLAVRDMVTGNKRRLTNKGTWSESTAFALFSTVSPDGKQVAYAWFTNDLTWELRAVGIDGSGSHVLYRGDATEYVQPDAWSPDGKRLAFHAAREGGGDEESVPAPQHAPRLARERGGNDGGARKPRRLRDADARAHPRAARPVRSYPDAGAAPDLAHQ